MAREADIPIEHAMLAWNAGWDREPWNQDPLAGKAKVFRHPDFAGASREYHHTVGACFFEWGKWDMRRRQLQLLLEAWHGVAHYEVEVKSMSDALMVVPEFRSMLADDCLPKEYRHERD